MRDRKKRKVKMSHCGWRMLLASCKVGKQYKWTKSIDREGEEGICEIMKRRDKQKGGRERNKPPFLT